MVSRRDLLCMGCALGASTLLQGAGMGETAPGVGSSASAGDPMSYVNPELRAGLQAVLAQFPMSDLNAETLPSQRQMSGRWSMPLLPQPAVEEKMIEGSAGSPKVRVYVTGASPGASKPAVLHIHGGGYVTGSASSERRQLQELTTAHDCVALSVDYRLAPETHFPGSLEDNYAALRWLFSNAAELGVDTKRIAIKGESAGGGHAAALAIAARNRGEVPICLQVLIYPMLDDRTGSSRHVSPYIGHYIWTESKNVFGWSSLLGVPAGSSHVPEGSVPARVADLKGLPATFIGVGSIDLFAPEDLEYAQRLILAGVPTEFSLVPGAFHGFDIIVADAAVSREFHSAWNDALKRAFTGA